MERLASILLAIVMAIACLYVYQTGHRPSDQSISQSQIIKPTPRSKWKRWLQWGKQKVRTSSYFRRGKKLVIKAGDTYDWHRIKNNPPIPNYFGRLVSHIDLLMWSEDKELFIALTLFLGFCLLGLSFSAKHYNIAREIPLLLMITMIVISMHWTQWAHASGISQKFNWLMATIVLASAGIWFLFRPTKKVKGNTLWVFINPFLAVAIFNMNFIPTAAQKAFPFFGGFFLTGFVLLSKIVLLILFFVAIGAAMSGNWKIPELGEFQPEKERVEVEVIPANQQQTQQQINGLAHGVIDLNNRVNNLEKNQRPTMNEQPVGPMAKLLAELTEDKSEKKHQAESDFLMEDW